MATAGRQRGWLGCDLLLECNSTLNPDQKLTTVANSSFQMRMDMHR